MCWDLRGERGIVQDLNLFSIIIIFCPVFLHSNLFHLFSVWFLPLCHFSLPPYFVLTFISYSSQVVMY